MKILTVVLALLLIPVMLGLMFTWTRQPLVVESNNIAPEMLLDLAEGLKESPDTSVWDTITSLFGDLGIVLVALTYFTAFMNFQLLNMPTHMVLIFDVLYFGSWLWIVLVIVIRGGHN